MTEVDSRQWPPGCFEAFYGCVEPRLRRALTARFGPDEGVEATHLALVWAWEHLPETKAIRSPVSYLFKVGSSRLLERQRSVADSPRVGVVDAAAADYLDLDLVAALRTLTERQRVICLLVHGAGWTQAEVAEGLSLAPSTVHEHLTAGMQLLRRRLEKDNEDEGRTPYQELR